MLPAVIISMLSVCVTSRFWLIVVSSISRNGMVAAEARADFHRASLSILTEISFCSM